LGIFGILLSFFLSFF